MWDHLKNELREFVVSWSILVRCQRLIARNVADGFLSFSLADMFMLIPKLEQTPFLWGVPIWDFFRLPAHFHTGSPHTEMGRVVLTHPWVTGASPKFWNFGRSNAHRCSPKIRRPNTNANAHRCSPKIGDQATRWSPKISATDNQPTENYADERKGGLLL